MYSVVPLSYSPQMSASENTSKKGLKWCLSHGQVVANYYEKKKKKDRRDEWMKQHLV